MEGENLKATHWRATAGLIMDYALVVVGAVCVALAADLFLIPNQVISGGVVGVATIPNAFVVISQAQEVLGEGFSVELDRAT